MQSVLIRNESQYLPWIGYQTQKLADFLHNMYTLSWTWRDNKMADRPMDRAAANESLSMDTEDAIKAILSKLQSQGGSAS